MAEETTATAEETTTSEETTEETTETTEEKGGGKSAEEYRRELREYERNAKKASAKKDKELADLQQKLKEREDEDKSEHDKAVEAAREEGRKAATSEAEKERRSDRLEVAVTRLAAKGVEVGEGDDAKTVRFADAEDALLHVLRGDTDDLFDDEGKVETDPLEEALRDLLKRKPHLAAGEGEKRVQGDADTRKGDKANRDLEAMSPEDHAKRKYAASK